MISQRGVHLAGEVWLAVARALLAAGGILCLGLTQNVGAATIVYYAGADLRAFEQTHSGDTAPVNGAWSYGGFNDASDRTFSPYAAAQHIDAWLSWSQIEGWVANTSSWVPTITVNDSDSSTTTDYFTVGAGKIFMHPGGGSANLDAPAIRWTAPEDGLVDLTATWRRIGGADARPVYVWMNSDATPLFSGYSNLSSSAPTYTSSSSLFVHGGDTINFVMTNGGSYSGTSTEFDATVTFIEIPEPSSLTMVIGGLFLVVCCTWRRAVLG